MTKTRLCGATFCVFLIGLSATAFAQGAPPAPQPAPAPAPTGAPPPPTGDVASATPLGAQPAPPNIRLRNLEQRVEALKEQAWRVKARVGMLKEAVLGGGI